MLKGLKKQEQNNTMQDLKQITSYKKKTTFLQPTNFTLGLDSTIIHN